LIEERRLRVFENRMLRRIFGLKRDEVTGEWRKLYTEERNDMYWSTNVVRVIRSRRKRWAGHVARMGERIGVYRVLVGISKGKSPLGRPMHKW
jgi:PAS domain-containing protein